MLKFEDGSDWLDKRISGVKKAYKIPVGLEKTAIAVDIGANVGAFPIVNSNNFSRIICIEPSEHSFNECKKNTKELNNVEVYKFAVGKKSNKLVKLKSYVEGNFSGNASIIDSKYWDDNNFEMVKTISLLDILKKFNLKKIDYLKVDCEGGEYDFLMGLDLSMIDYLGIEIHIQLGNKCIELEKYLKERFDVISEIGDGIKVHKEITMKNKNK